MIGVKAGPNIHNLSSNNEGSFDARVNATAGIFAALKLGNVFLIQPEFLVARGGADQTTSNGRTDVSLSYFQVPVLFKFRLPLGSTVFPNVFLGPSADFVTNARYSHRSNSPDIIRDPDIRKIGMGGLIGAGIDFEIGRLFLSLDGRYGFGLTNISDDYLAVQGRYYTFTAGVGFRFGGE